MSFGPTAGYPTTPWEILPGDFRVAMGKSSRGESDSHSDRIMGSVDIGEGYCSDPKYKKQIYCACVNAPISYPECAFKPCTEDEGRYGAYKTRSMLKTMENKSKNCPKSITCNQIFKAGGSDNISSNINQEINCGGVENNKTAGEDILNKIQKHPVLVVLVMIILISVIMLIITTPSNPSDEKKLAHDITAYMKK